MAWTMTLFGAWGAVAVGAAQCEKQRLVSELGACDVTDMATDSGQFFFTTTCNEVWMCMPPDPYLYEDDWWCQRLGVGRHQPTDVWDQPAGIAVHSSPDGSRVVYISEDSAEKPWHPGCLEECSGSVKKCFLVENPQQADDKFLECLQFENFTLFPEAFWKPQGLAVHPSGDVLLTDGHSMWRCDPWRPFCYTPSEVMTLDGQPKGIAADSEGKVFIAGTLDNVSITTGFVYECTGSGCADYGAHRNISGLVGIAASSVDNSTDDFLYIRDELGLIRCSPSGTCEDVAACDGGLPSRFMAVDDSFVYSVTRSGDNELELYRFQFPNDNFLQI